MILILTNKQDVSADFVVRELRRRGAAYVRVNTEDLRTGECSFRLSPAPSVTIDRNGSSVKSSDIGAVWHRRPGHAFDEVPTPERPAPDEEKFVVEQWMVWIEALEVAISDGWMNPLTPASLFENKIRQLSLARRIGFTIPDTIVSNSPSAIKNFRREHHAGLAAKALYAPLLEGIDRDRFVFTSLVESGHLNDAAALRQAPTIFQEALIPKVDYRVTIVGTKIFAVKVCYPPQDGIDWRVSKAAVQFVPIELPAEIAGMCLKFVQNAGLVFGAIDLIESRGEWYFIEINPSGEWGWLQQPVGLPIAEAICDTLQALDTTR